MTRQTKNLTIDFLLGGLAILLTASFLLQATPLSDTLAGLPLLGVVYVLLHGVEYSLRCVAAWCMSWAEGIAHRKRVVGKWDRKLRAVKAGEASVESVYGERLDTARAVSA